MRRVVATAWPMKPPGWALASTVLIGLLLVVGAPAVNARSAAAASGTIAPGGPPVTFTIASTGGSISATFQGTAGRRIALKASGNTIPGARTKILLPGSTTKTLADNASYIPGSDYLVIDAHTLPTTGVYTIVITSSTNGTGQVTLTLYDVPPDTVASGALNTPITVPATTVPGQNAWVYVPTQAGHRISVQVTKNAMPNLRVSVYAGSQYTDTSATPVAANSSYTSTSGTSLPIEPVSVNGGTYSVLLDPAQLGTGTATIVVWDVPPDIQDSLTLNGPSRTEQIATPGQNAYATFQAYSGETINLTVSGGSGLSCKVSVKNPDPNPNGTLLISPGPLYCGAAHTFTKSLVQSGIYEVKIDPYIDSTGNATLTLTGTPGADGASLITGRAEVGQTITAGGSWIGTPSSFSYQWQRCDGQGQNCVGMRVVHVHGREQRGSIDDRRCLWESAVGSDRSSSSGRCRCRFGGSSHKCGLRRQRV